MSFPTSPSNPDNPLGHSFGHAPFATVPDIVLQSPSDTSSNASLYRQSTMSFQTQGTAAPQSAMDSNIWRCCHCMRQQHVFPSKDKQPAEGPRCGCGHQACEGCAKSGFAHFADHPSNSLAVPVSSPMVNDNEDDEGKIRCKACGCIWVEEEEKNRTLKKRPSWKGIRDLYKGRLTPRTGKKLPKSQSLFNMTFRSSTHLAEDVRLEDPESAKIMKCKCGNILNPPPFEEPAVKEVAPPEPSRATDETLLAKGHHSNTINIRGVRHPNPLRSNPVD
ncbi:hypothetical protein B0J11DRAFT_612270 [Dendryphion nanum]|uniref:Uncharacterized protein n=1 Tax=Dendryphion nanum TaxID=256645 RepID=A0A9P9E7J9_9PLEO|nr:hypothetical protein B0J11DRAFT_612270 [Dendryphion nanum]